MPAMLIAPQNLILFVSAALVLLVTPGPAVLYIVARSLEQGKLAGVASVAGVGLGGLVHVLGAVFGLSAIVAASPFAFRVLALVGAGYLIVLGIRSIRQVSRALPSVAPSGKALRRVLADGVIVNLFNPKAAMFFLAFLPQFVDPSRGSTTAQLAVLGGLFLGMAVVTDLGYVAAARSLDRCLQGRDILRVPGVVSGVVYLLLGIGAAFAARLG